MSNTTNSVKRVNFKNYLKFYNKSLQKNKFVKCSQLILYRCFTSPYYYHEYYFYVNRGGRVDASLIVLYY